MFQGPFGQEYQPRRTLAIGGQGLHAQRNAAWYRTRSRNTVRSCARQERPYTVGAQHRTLRNGEDVTYRHRLGLHLIQAWLAVPGRNLRGGKACTRRSGPGIRRDQM